MFLNPIKGQSFVTQRFGERPSVYKQFGLKGHNGIDMRAPTGTPLYAPIDGVVTVTNEGTHGYGLYVRIRNKDYECVIAHLSRATVVSGAFVRLGDPIGLSGNTGFSTAPHVHYGVRKLNPDGTIKDQNNGVAGYLDIEPYTIVWTGLLNGR